MLKTLIWALLCSSVFAQDFLNSPWFTKKEKQFLKRAYAHDYLAKKFKRKLQQQGRERSQSIKANSARLQREFDKSNRFSALTWPSESALIKYKTIELEFELRKLEVPKL